MDKKPITFLGQIHFSYSVLSELVKVGVVPNKVIILKDDFLPFNIDLKINENWFKEYQEYYFWIEKLENLCNKYTIDYNIVDDYKKYLSPNKYLIVAGFSKILPNCIIDLFEVPLNIHPSLLPYYKGPQPEAKMILNNENYFGLSIHKLTNKIDSGEIYFQEALDGVSELNVYNLEKRESILAATGILKIINNEYKKIYQEDITSYFSYVTKNELNIKNYHNLKDIKNLVRLHPEEFPFFKFGNKIIYPIEFTDDTHNSIKFIINDNAVYIKKWLEEYYNVILYKSK